MESTSILLLHNEVILLLLLIYIVHHAEDVKFPYTYVYIYICRFFSLYKDNTNNYNKDKGKKHHWGKRRKICKTKYIVKTENKTQL